MKAARLGAGILFGLLAPCLVAPLPAQIAPRLTGATVLAQLDTAQHDLAARAASLPNSGLAATSQRLAQLEVALRKALGNDTEKPIDIIGADAKASAYRASAAVQRTQAYLDATKGCLTADATTMAAALATTVDLLAGESGSSKTQPVINGVETMDHRQLFVLGNSSKEVAFALVGTNLVDTQCEDPVVSATDRQGKRLVMQPSVTGVSPSRIELKLANSADLPSGSYVLHVQSKHKAFLVGCTAQPEAVAVVQAAPPVKAAVSYGLTATCRVNGAEHAMPPVTGTLPDLAGGNAVSQQIATDGCSDPVSYAITATVTFSDGHSASIGPISQIASAGITAGLQGGYSLSWDPSVHQIFVRASPSTCKGIY